MSTLTSLRRRMRTAATWMAVAAALSATVVARAQSLAPTGYWQYTGTGDVVGTLTSSGTNTSGVMSVGGTGLPIYTTGGMVGSGVLFAYDSQPTTQAASKFLALNTSFGTNAAPVGGYALGTTFSISTWYFVSSLSGTLRSYIYEGLTNDDVSAGNPAGGSTTLRTYNINVNQDFTGAMATGSWRHLAQTVTLAGGTSTMVTYLDGIASGTLSTSVTGGSTGINLATARSGTNPPTTSQNRPLNGTLDETAVWQTKALSAAEVLAVYNRGLAGVSLTNTATVAGYAAGSTDNAWLTGANWASGTAPGQTGSPSSTNGNVAVVGNHAFGGGLGIDMAAATGNLALGAITFNSLAGSGGLSIGNSAAANGTLTLNGAQIDGFENVVLNNEGLSNLTITNVQGSDAGQRMTLQLGGTTSMVRTAAGRTLTITTDITERAAGSSLTVDGGGTVVLGGTNTYSGGTVVSAGRLAGTSTSLQGEITNNAAVEFVQTVGGTYAGNMSGSGSLTKTGAGVVTLSGSNSFSGGTTVSAGSVAAAAIADAGLSNIGTSGTLALTGGTLDYTGSGAATTARVVDIGTGNTTSTIGVADVAGRLTLTGKVWNSDVAHPNVVLSKTGPGTLEIAGAGSNVGTSLVVQTGTVVLNATQRAVYEVRGLDTGATLRLERSDQIFSGDAITTTGNIRMTGGTLDLNGFNETVNRVSGADFSTAGTGVITSAAPAQFTFGNNLAGRPSRFAGTITGAVSVTVKGTNPVTLSGDNTYSGSTTIQDAGTQLRIGVGGTTGSLGAGAVLNAGQLVFDRSDAVTVSNAISGSGSITQAGAGTVTLTGTNSYAGSTTVSAGRLVGTTASLPGAIANAAQVEFAQVVTGTYLASISGTGSFAKSGPGNLVVSGSNSYTGPTTVSAGRLSVNGSLANTPVSVASGTLGGSGSIAGPVSVATGGFLAPGNSIESLATGTATFAAGATFEYEVDSTNLSAFSTAADLLVVSGDLNLDPGNGSLLTFADLAGSPNPFVEDTTVFAMINYAGVWNGGLFTFNGTVLDDGDRFLAGNQLWEIDYNYVYDTANPTTIRPLNFQGDYQPSSGTQTFVAVTAVPEPSTIVLAAVGVGLATVARFRRRAASGRRPNAV